MNNYVPWILMIVFAVLGIVIFFSFLSGIKKRKEMYEKLDDPVELSPVELFNVKVVNKYCDTIREGSVKYPKSRNAYFLSFEFDDGSVKTFEVDVSLFDTIFYGEVGELAVSDGRFIEFNKF